MVRFLLIATVVSISLLAECSPSRPPEISYFEVVGEQERRVEIVTSMLAKFHEPPTPLLDANFVEEKIGDDELGPADYRAFAMVEVAPGEIERWIEFLVPLDSPPTYRAPSQRYDWWVRQEVWGTLEYFEPDPLAGRANGWVAVDRADGKIYIYSFTT